MNVADDNARPATDALLLDLADYVVGAAPGDDATYETASWALLDAVGCGLLALNHPACRRFVAAIGAGTATTGGVPVPGTNMRLDAVNAAFAIGAANRWLDFNDTWLAKEWGHPSDNVAAILTAAAQRNQLAGGGDRLLLVGDVLAAMVKAYEIQGVLAMDTAFNRLGLDHVFLLRLASTAVATWLLGGSRDEVANAMSQVFADGAALRTYRHAPNTGPRKSWASGDAASRAVRLALLTLAGEPGYPGVLSTPTWGFDDVVLRGASLSLPRPPGSYVMDNLLFKVLHPAEFHAQTALEAAIALHPKVIGRIDDVAAVHISTQESAVRIISKTGPLHNAADRDHCLQYIVAIGLLKGGLTAEDYDDAAADDPRIDQLREGMTVSENPDFTADYLDPQRRSIANTVHVRFTDGTRTDSVTVEYPLGHRRRRGEAWPQLRQKLHDNVLARLPRAQTAAVMRAADDHAFLSGLRVEDFLRLFERQM